MEELEDNTNNVLNGFSVPQNVKETGDKSETPQSKNQRYDVRCHMIFQLSIVLV